MRSCIVLISQRERDAWGFVPRACAPLQAVNSRSVRGAEDLSLTVCLLLGTKEHMFTTGFLLPVDSSVLMLFAFALPVFKPTSCYCLLTLWCYNSRLVQLPSSHCLSSSCYISHGPHLGVHKKPNPGHAKGEGEGAVGDIGHRPGIHGRCNIKRIFTPTF